MALFSIKLKFYTLRKSEVIEMINVWNNKSEKRITNYKFQLNVKDEFFFSFFLIMIDDDEV